jgi:hypothetical protein
MDVEGFGDRALIPFLERAPPRLLPRSYSREEPEGLGEGIIAVAVNRDSFHHNSNALLVLET